MILLSLLFSVAAMGQDGPFLFTVTSPAPGDQPAFIHYDAAYGRETFEPFGGDNIEQNIGIRTHMGESLMLIAHLGMALDGRSTRMSQHGELIAHLMKSGEDGIDVSAGPGMRHEYGGTNEFTSWQLYGNLLLERPLSSDRDNIDLITTFGLSYHVSGSFRLGIEAVGQDLEGFWDENEAEGGAILFVGPTLSVVPPGTPWGFTLGGGAIIRASQNARTSDAVRDLPTGKQNGFVIRSVVSFRL
jgi:hypothetical protein